MVPGCRFLLNERDQLLELQYPTPDATIRIGSQVNNSAAVIRYSGRAS